LSKEGEIGRDGSGSGSGKFGKGGEIGGDGGGGGKLRMDGGGGGKLSRGEGGKGKCIVKREIKEMSILQCLAMSLNLLTGKKAWDERGWQLLTMGRHKGRNPLGEWAQTKHYTPEVRTVLSSLMMAYQILEFRTQKFAILALNNSNLFDEQIALCLRYEKAWEEKHPLQQLRVPLFLRLVQEVWLTLDRGTVMHRDKGNVGLSFAYYLGFGWDGSLGIGFPGLGFGIKTGPGCVVGIRAASVFHMSGDPSEGKDSVTYKGFRIMGAGYVNESNL